MVVSFEVQHNLFAAGPEGHQANFDQTRQEVANF